MTAEKKPKTKNVTKTSSAKTADKAEVKKTAGKQPVQSPTRLTDKQKAALAKEKEAKAKALAKEKEAKAKALAKEKEAKAKAAAKEKEARAKELARAKAEKEREKALIAREKAKALAEKTKEKERIAREKEREKARLLKEKEAKARALAKEKDTDESKDACLRSVMYHLYEVLRVVSVLAEPVIPDACKVIFDELGLKDEEKKLAELKFGIELNNKVIEKPVVLFKRLDAAVELEKYKEK